MIVTVSSAKSALAKIEAVLKKHDPAAPFKADFVDEEFARKFGNEKRIGQLCPDGFKMLMHFLSDIMRYQTIAVITYWPVLPDLYLLINDNCPDD